MDIFLGVQKIVTANSCSIYHVPDVKYIKVFNSHNNYLGRCCHYIHFTGEEVKAMVPESMFLITSYYYSLKNATFDLCLGR